MGYQIMNRNLDAYSLSGDMCIEYYERAKKFHLDPKDSRYGDVLVKTKQVFSGIEIKAKLFLFNHWYWKPEFKWKHNPQFHWLFFMIFIETIQVEKIDRIIKDHLEHYELTF